MMMEGERAKGRGRAGRDIITQKASVGYEAFNMENNEGYENETDTTNSNCVRLIKNNENQNLRSQDLFPCSI